MVSAGTYVNLAYDLHCTGSYSAGEPAPPVSASDRLPLLGPVCHRDCRSGLTSLALDAYARVGAPFELTGAWCEIARAVDPYWGSFASARAEMICSQQWQVPEWSGLACSPLAFHVAYAGTLDQTLAWPADSRTLPATGTLYAEGAQPTVRSTHICAQPGDSVSVSWMGAAELQSGGNTEEAEVGAIVGVTVFSAIIEDETGATWFGARYTCAPGHTLRLACRPFSAFDKGARTWLVVWGPPLELQDAENPTLGRHVQFTPTSPGLYVIRTTITSPDDRTTAGFNTQVLVTGSMP